MRSHGRPAFSLRLLLVSVLSSTLVPAVHAHPGRWVPAYDMEQQWNDPTAVHLMLLRGDGAPFHSRVVWLKGRAPNAWFGGEWGWRPPGSGTCQSWPDASFVKLDLLDPQANIFCAGHTALGDGRTLLVGGTESGSERGMRFVKYLTPGAGVAASAWSTPDSMNEKRWYPAATTLKEGDRALVSAGSKYGHLQFWGGRRNGASSPTDTLLWRFGIVAAGQWDSDILPRVSGSGKRPGPREGHAVAHGGGWGLDFYFGGRRSDKFLNDAWRLYRNRDVLNSEYDYNWQEFGIDPASPQQPDPRFEHSAVTMRTKDLVIFGGRGSKETIGHQVYSDVWRLWNDTDEEPHAWKWKLMKTSGASPGPRFGHTAIWDPGYGRMLVFGGVGADTSAAATDSDVYALTVQDATPDSGVWSKPEVIGPGPRPAARFDHAMSYQDFVRADPDSACCEGRVAYMYGGKSGPSTFCGDTLWGLWSYDHGPYAGKLRWRSYPYAGRPPSLRSGHTFEIEAGSFVNFLFGGVNAAGTADDTVYAIDLSKDHEPTPTWRTFALRGATLSNHVVMRSDPVHARTPEVFKEAAGFGNDWQSLTGSKLLQDWYGFNFLVPGAGGDSSRVFAAGPDDLTHLPHGRARGRRGDAVAQVQRWLGTLRATLGLGGPVRAGQDHALRTA